MTITVDHAGIFRLLVESSSAASVIILDPRGNIEYANPVAGSWRGLNPAAIVGIHLSAFYKTAEEVDQILKSASDKGRHDENGWQKTTSNGKFWAYDVFSPLNDPKTGLIGYSMLTYDLTRIKESEIRLRESEQRYRLLVEGVKDYAIFMLDPNGIISSWNEGARRLKGYEDYEVIGKHFSLFYTSEALHANKPPRELEIARTTGRYEEEGWRVKKDGSLFWANVVITALFNDRNELMGFSKVTRDLTERRKGDELLKASEEQYRLLVTSVKDYGIYMLDTKGRIASWNTGAMRILGYTEDEVLGKHFSIFYPKEDADNEKPQLELTIAREAGRFEEETWRIRKNGERFWASVVLTSMYNADKKLIGFAKITRDLTERKRAENALRSSEERLRRANKELNQSNQELERFTSVASHDLQEPLRTIRNYLSLIQSRMGEIEPDVKNHMERTIAAADRMKELILSLLQYSRLSSERSPFADVKLDEALSEVMSNMRSAIEESGAEVTFDIQVETVFAHRIQIVQLFQNLISNAIKFVKDRKPKVHVTGVDEGEHYKFSVTDNGIGIEPRYQAQIFDIFKRLHGRSEYSGSGIGLAICKKIVEVHHGQLWVESVPNEGSTFHFTLQKYPRELASNYQGSA
jgi:PAS domain S-box-containing protein